MVIIAPGFLITYFLPNQKLNDSQNLVEEHGMFEGRVTLEQHQDEKTAGKSARSEGKSR